MYLSFFLSVRVLHHTSERHDHLLLPAAYQNSEALEAMEAMVGVWSHILGDCLTLKARITSRNSQKGLRGGVRGKPSHCLFSHDRS